MQHLVVLDARSVIGAAYLKGVNDGIADGNPCLTCSSLDSTDPHYAEVVRSYRYRGESRQQRLRIPHHAIAFVVPYEIEGQEAELRPFGFQPTAPAAD